MSQSTRRPWTSFHYWPWAAYLAFIMLAMASTGTFLVSSAMSHAQSTAIQAEVEERLRDADKFLEKALLAYENLRPGDQALLSWQCVTGLPSANKDIHEAQLFIVSGRLESARRSVAAARKRNTNCFNDGAASLMDAHHSLNSTFKPSKWRGLVSMMVKANKILKDVESLLRFATDLTSPGFVNETDYREIHEPAHVERDDMILSSSEFMSSQVHQQQLTGDIGHGLEGWRVSKAQPYPCQVDGTKCQYTGCGQGRNLVSCSFGFAKGLLGGYNGQSYVVTSEYDNPENPPYGTLRYGLNLARSIPGGVWITFSRDMRIELRGQIWVHSHTTVDGRGFKIIIQQFPLLLSEAKQVILENIQVDSVRSSDTVHIFNNCWKVWVDHVTSFGGDLGLVSVVQGSTDVTISNCKLSNHNFNMLLGASDHDYQDKNMRVTVYRNHFSDSMQRMPHCRWGWCHVANNLYTNWGYYAIGARVNARVKTEYNVFVPSRANEVTPWHPGASSSSFDFSARIESKGDVLMNGATFHQFLEATHDVRPPYPNGEYPPLVSADKVRYLVSVCAGAHTPVTMQACWKAPGV